MNQRGSYAPIGIIATSNGPHLSVIRPNSGCSAVSPANRTEWRAERIPQPHHSVEFRLFSHLPEKCWAGTQVSSSDPTADFSHQSHSATVRAPRRRSEEQTTEL